MDKPPPEADFFVLFPDEWEGQHEAFPNRDHATWSTSPLAVKPASIFFGTIAGVLVNSFRALRRRPLDHAVLKCIGAAQIVYTAKTFYQKERARQEVLPDVKALLKAEGKELPPRKFIKVVRSTRPTLDVQMLFGAATSVIGLSIYRRAPNMPKLSLLAVIGLASVGASAVVLTISKTAEQAPESMARSLEYQKALLHGAMIWSVKTGKPHPPLIYGGLSAVIEPLKTGQEAQEAQVEQMLRAAHPQMTDSEIEDMLTGQALDQPGLAPLPPGTAPHAVMKALTGKPLIMPQRDYEFNPSTQRSGLEILEDHLSDLQASRARAAKTAEYLWTFTATREASNYPPYARDQSSASITQEKKALELLTSIHKQTYSGIADLDWCIANTKKLMLQLRSEGKWVPGAMDAADAAEARKKVLNTIKSHGEALEMQAVAMEEELKIVPLSEAEKEEARREQRGNVDATRMLIRELERADGGTS